MCRWICLGSAVIPSDAVPRRHYFMEFLQEPEVIYGLRILCIVLAIGAFVIYWKMKKDSGE